MAKRLPPQAGEWIKREQPLDFYFEGERVAGFAGDVLSSALLANGHRTLARSFKYHRPRGVLSLANHDANVLLCNDDATHIRADVVSPIQGAQYRAVNTLGGLKRDAMQCLSLLSPFLPVGFYYKALYRPKMLFPLWERLIRATAGLGKINPNAECQRSSRRHAYCDVLVIGAGPSGLAAAKSLADGSLSVIVIDENAHLGGSLGYQSPDEDGKRDRQQELLERIDRAPNITTLPGHFAAGFYADNSVPAVGPAGLINIHAGSVIVATGVYEQPAVFRNNDLPGVMLASAAQRLVHRFAVLPFESACMVAGNDDAYRAALDLQRAGAEITAIIDLDEPQSRGEYAAQAVAAGIQIIGNSVVEQAISRGGALSAIDVRGRANQTRQQIECDGLLMSVGWAPAAGLLYQAGAKLGYNDAVGQVIPEALPPSVFVAGRVNGVYELNARIEDGLAAAADASSYLRGAEGDAPRPSRSLTRQSHPYPITPHPKGRDFVDFDEDIQVGDLRTAWREGFDSVELIKRYSTIGMGPSQGKTSNMNGVRILARLNQQPVGAIGVTTTRPFTHPVPMGQLAGRRMRRTWRTPMHRFHAEQNADLQEAGTWLRPMSYTRGSPTQAIEQEYRTVRNGVGLIDVSTLGKIELFGPDVNALLEYVYTCRFDKLKIGMTRYIFMVDGGGTLSDDGVAARLADDHLYITATSSHAQAVVRQLQLVVAQLELDVVICDRTFQVGALNLAGPKARQVLEKLTDIDLSHDAFPYLACRSALVAGVEARLMRVGFVGELGYEIHLPASQAAHVWEALLSAGADCEIKPFGVEAQRLLRLEKGHLIFGQDTDGTTNPFEVGLGWGVTLGKSRFHGKHSLTLLKPRIERHLVGFETKASEARELAECHLLIDNGDIVGRITSIAFSPHRQASIGLAIVPTHLKHPGSSLNFRLSDGTIVVATVVKTPFYDPDNARQTAEDHAHA